ncbi:tRNA (adenosine(37)-N6)-dimethylallyltransferase MiaA [Secundilactobacillus hailunensis]|uniref:tRNA dimethylallyltransferase n=1 Tax=Secundilactobacillus hailunensis TaxID=2559923 RepID=A0ABW1TCD3_9LACO|nr:tRNA (adenosine(37)-N6)-dimethylallyltransferase MiaA [Secundilactobacillus hailunensis]
MKKVLAIIGPTAVGKTALSLELAARFQGEIISGDSMQVYRGLDIGTAKIMPADRQHIPHYLIDIRNIDERYSVADFVAESRRLIDDISARGGLPMIVGGTGFYLKALLYDMNLGGDHFEQSKQVRNKWHDYATVHGQQALWDHLNKIDPDAASKIPVTNERRVVRALEVYERTGTLFSKQQTTLQPRYDAYVIGLNTDRAKVYERINQRVDQMLSMGLLEEARKLYEAGGEQWQSGKGIGYRELFPYFKDDISKTSAIEKIKQDTRHYAKRQLTWFRHQIPVHWYDIIADPTQKKAIGTAVSAWLEK